MDFMPAAKKLPSSVRISSVIDSLIVAVMPSASMRIVPPINVTVLPSWPFA